MLQKMKRLAVGLANTLENNRVIIKSKNEREPHLSLLRSGPKADCIVKTEIIVAV